MCLVRVMCAYVCYCARESMSDLNTIKSIRPFKRTTDLFVTYRIYSVKLRRLTIHKLIVANG